jgi:hypothetical protein
LNFSFHANIFCGFCTVKRGDISTFHNLVEWILCLVKTSTKVLKNKLNCGLLNVCTRPDGVASGHLTKTSGCLDASSRLLSDHSY